MPPVSKSVLAARLAEARAYQPSVTDLRRVADGFGKHPRSAWQMALRNEKLPASAVSFVLADLEGIADLWRVADRLSGEAQVTAIRQVRATMVLVRRLLACLPAIKGPEASDLAGIVATLDMVERVMLAGDED